MAGSQHQAHLLSLHGSGLPRVKTIMKHPFPWSQAAFCPVFTFHSGREWSPLLWYCRVNNIALLILWASVMGELWGLVVVLAVRFLQLSFQPWSFCFESGCFQPGLDFQRSDVPAHFVLSELAPPCSPHWTCQCSTWALQLPDPTADTPPLRSASRSHWGLLARRMWS